MKEEDFNALLRQEEEYVEQICAQIVAAKPDIVITEKGVSDLAQHYFVKAGITAFRRLRKTDANRVARYMIIDILWCICLYVYVIPLK